MAYEQKVLEMIAGAQSMDHMGEIDQYVKNPEVKSTLSVNAKQRLLSHFKAKLTELRGGASA